MFIEEVRSVCKYVAAKIYTQVIFYAWYISRYCVCCVYEKMWEVLYKKYKIDCRTNDVKRPKITTVDIYLQSFCSMSRTV